MGRKAHQLVPTTCPGSEHRQWHPERQELKMERAGRPRRTPGSTCGTLEMPSSDGHPAGTAHGSGTSASSREHVPWEGPCIGEYWWWGPTPAHPPLTLLSHSSHTALTLLSHCSHTALTLLSHCSHTALTLHPRFFHLLSPSSRTALAPLSHGSHTARTLL